MCSLGQQGLGSQACITHAGNKTYMTTQAVKAMAAVGLHAQETQQQHDRALAGQKHTAGYGCMLVHRRLCTCMYRNLRLQVATQ